MFFIIPNEYKDILMLISMMQLAMYHDKITDLIDPSINCYCSYRTYKSFLITIFKIYFTIDRNGTITPCIFDRNKNDNSQWLIFCPIDLNTINTKSLSSLRYKSSLV